MDAPAKPGGDPLRCSRCGTESPPHARFCMECGAALARRCSACGVDLPPAAKFCLACGTPATAGQAASSGADGTASAAPRRAWGERSQRDYTPRHLADKILRTRTALEGERKQVTVLFADILGSLDLAQQAGAEDWHAILDRFFEILTGVIHRYEGTVNQYTGDGVMALFGAPVAHEDHAQRACHAALQILEELRGFADDLRRDKGLALAIRMGLNSGEVVVGKIGDDLRMDYTAQGLTVGLAARVQQIASPDRAYLASSTARLVEGYFRLRSLGGMPIRGVPDPVEVFELQGPGVLRTRFDLARARGLTRFVGRAAEMAVLEAALERTLTGRGQVVGVVGYPGVGKTRLCYEFAEYCRARDIAVRTAHGVSHGQMLPFLPMRELLRDFVGARDDDDEHTVRSKITGELMLVDESLAEHLTVLFDFMRVPDPRRPLPAMDPGQRQARLLDAFGRLMQARSRTRPAVLIFEDLQWIDKPSDTMIASLIEQSANTRTLFVVAFRPEYRAPWMAKSIYHQLPLLPLDDEGIASLAADLLGTDPSVAGLDGLVRERTAGNPFFLEELVRALVEAGDLEGSPGAFRLLHPVRSLTIPPSVQALLAARIDRLGENAKIALQTAAVLGKRFNAALLQKVVALSADDLQRALKQLCDAEFLYLESFHPVAEYSFLHPLTLEIAYNSTLGDVRARHHLAAAQALAETKEPGSEAEQVAVLADHLERAGQVLEAAEHHAEAADRYLLRYDDAAFSHYRRALELALQVDGTPESVQIAIDACARLLDWAGRLRVNAEEAVRLYESGREVARASGDRGALARIESCYAVFAIWQGVISDARAPLEAAVALGEALGSGEDQARAQHDLALAQYFSGELEGATRGFERVIGRYVEWLDERPLEVPAALAGVVGPALPMLGHCLLERGLLAACRGKLNQILPNVERQGATIAEAVVRSVEGLLWVALGEPEEALETALRAVTLSEGSLLRTAPVDAYRALGEACMLAGDLVGAASAAECALEIANQTEPGLVTGISSRITLSLVRTRLGDAGLGFEFAERAVRDSSQRGYTLVLPEAFLARARARIALGGGGEAGAMHASVEDDIDRARALLEKMGRRVLHSEVALVEAALACALGNLELAGLHRERARHACIEIGAPRRAELIEAGAIE